MTPEFRKGLVTGMLAFICMAGLAFLATNFTRPLQALWWNNGFEAGRASAVKDCTDREHYYRCQMPYGK